MLFPFRLFFFSPSIVFTCLIVYLCQADSKQTTVVLRDCLGSICSSGAVIYKVLPKSWKQYKQEIPPWKAEAMYLLGNANENLNIKERRRWQITRSCSRREDGWGHSNHLMQGKRELKARKSGINKETQPWKSSQADCLLWTCLVRMAGAPCRMR